MSHGLISKEEYENVFKEVFGPKRKKPGSNEMQLDPNLSKQIFERFKS